MMEINLYNRPHVIVRIPTLRFDEFKRRVLGTYFGGDYPWLVKHVKSSNAKYTMATFSSDDGEDINAVLSMLPVGSSFSFAKGC